MKELQASLNELLKGKITPLVVDGIIGRNTRNSIDILRSRLEKIYIEKKYTWNENNLICIRLDDIFDNQFTDICFINIANQNYSFPMSTLAGLNGVGNVFNPNWIDGVFGVGVVKEGYYKEAYQLNTGWWTGLPFLMQIADFEFYRDGNRNITLDRGQIYKGKKGFNLHSWAGFFGNVVNNLSQGCMVFRADIYTSQVVPLLNILANKYNNKIDFCLLHKNDLDLT